MTLWRATIAAHAALLLLFLRVPALSIAVLLGYAAYHVGLAWAILHPRAGWIVPNQSRLATTERVCALTFDDGPHPTITPRVLDLLAQRGVRATFFVIGRWVERYPEIVRRMAAEGHEVANHTATHPYTFWLLSPAATKREVTAASGAIERATGRACHFFRAPVGMKGPFLARALREAGLRLTSWDVRFLDRSADPQRLAARLTRRLRPGSILMLHDGHDRKGEGNPVVLDALPVVLDRIADLGYRIVPLPGSSLGKRPLGLMPRLDP